MAINMITYNEDGHRYTTFVVARLAGWDVSEALELSWGSQLPDVYDDLKAVDRALDWFEGEEPKRIMRVLHSLHGGDVQKRRTGLKTYISEMLASKQAEWKVGVVIHAFGDSYAHTREENGKEVAYGAPFGHLLDGHRPDHVPLFPEKFKLYVSDLYGVLLVSNSAGGQGVSEVAKIAGLKSFPKDVKALADKLGYDNELSKGVQGKLNAKATTREVLDLLVHLEKRLTS
ncbi:hypothetical protein [Xanthomonas sp. SI]|uniref:hypothetical protein n=1 Tax=Xanthomonas sp. SI TaxID=2724123 RepID=UPI001639AF86|nr:hypothetical protein [Xanthomonas sp. SI]QNH12693.1 hypothetical protein HEP75_02131 [Xanthomonas sp. SI]